MYEDPEPKYSAMTIMKILLNPSIDKTRVAQKRPVEVKCSSTFVIDVTRLSHPDDIKKVVYGKWLHKGSHTDVFRCSFSENSEVRIEKAPPGATGSNVYSLRRLHSVHPTNNAFRRVLAFIFGKLCKTIHHYHFWITRFRVDI